MAFATDPVMRWAWSDAHQYTTYWPRIADAFGGRAFDHGTAHGLADFLAVALWLPPGVGPDEEAFVGVLEESLDERILEVFLRTDGFLEQMDHVHPSVDHWYLTLTGVDAFAQGQGLGSTILRHGLAKCDRDGLPAYLEATSPRSRDFYLRHGFEVIGVIQSGPSPPMWAMLREPAGAE